MLDSLLLRFHPCPMPVVDDGMGMVVVEWGMVASICRHLKRLKRPSPRLVWEALSVLLTWAVLWPLTWPSVISPCVCHPCLWLTCAPAGGKPVSFSPWFFLPLLYLLLVVLWDSRRGSLTLHVRLFRVFEWPVQCPEILTPLHRYLVTQIPV